RLDHVNPGVIEQVRVGQIEHAPLRIHLERGHLLEAKGEIQVAIGEIGPPFACSPGTIGRTVAANPGKGKNILLESGIIGPVGRSSAVCGYFPRGATSIKFGLPSFASAIPGPKTLGQGDTRRKQDDGDSESGWL